MIKNLPFLAHETDQWYTFGWYKKMPLEEYTTSRQESNAMALDV